MNLHPHEQPNPGPASLLSPTQHSEIATILAGKWPALKPLPVLKYEADDHRTSIDFDKLRGEWVCRKTWLPSGRVQELRGGLGQILSALPGAAVDASSGIAAEAAEQELAKDAERRRQSMLEWREQSANGRRYAELQGYLCESQRREIDDSLRLTLTARQLQCSAKNIAYIFDALASAGGRFATLLESALEAEARNKVRGEVSSETATAQSHLPLDVPPHTAAYALGAAVGGSASLRPEPQTMLPVETVFPERDHVYWTEPISCSATQLVESAKPGNPYPSWLAPGNDLQQEEDFPEEEEALLPQEEARQPAANQQTSRRRERASEFAEFVRNGEFAEPITSDESSPAHARTLELSGFHLAALAFLFAVISFSVGLAMSRGLFGEGLVEAQKTMLASAGKSSAPPERSGEATTPPDAPPAADALDSKPAIIAASPGTPPSQPSPQTRQSPQTGQTPQTPAQQAESAPVSSQDVASNASAASARTTIPPAAATDRYLTNPDSPAIGTKRNEPAAIAGNSGMAGKSFSPIAKVSSTDVIPNKVAPITGLTPYHSRPSAVLVTTPSRGNKAFRVIFPEKAIAASSSFAMTSQFSVVVPPEPGTAMSRRSARLQAGELQSFAWPRYTRLGDRSASAETVKVRATIGKLGQLQEIKLVSGSSSLFPAVSKAMHQWHYRPTLLNQNPVASQQEVTIEFRPTQYVSRVHEPYSARNE